MFPYEIRFFRKVFLKLQQEQTQNMDKEMKEEEVYLKKIDLQKLMIIMQMDSIGMKKRIFQNKV